LWLLPDRTFDPQFAPLAALLVPLFVAMMASVVHLRRLS